MLRYLENEVILFIRMFSGKNGVARREEPYGKNQADIIYIGCESVGNIGVGADHFCSA